MKNKLMEMIINISNDKKKVTALKTGAVLSTAAAAALSTSVTAFAAGPDLSKVVEPIVDLINAIINPTLAIVGALGVLYCIFLAVKYAKAEEPQEREKRKQALKTAIIGYLLIFILIVALKLSIGPLTDWMNSSVTGADQQIELNTAGEK